MSNDTRPVKLAGRCLFDTGHLKDGLKGRSVRGGATTAIAQSAQFVIQMGSTVVLARLLAPADFGLIAMVTAVTGFASLFKDLGLSLATVQKAEVTHEQVSNLFWANVGISVVIALITAALAPLIAWFYGEPRLTMIAIALTLAFLSGGFTVQHQALLQRQMRFGALGAVQIISTLVSVVAAIVTAMIGAGYWSLVIMQVTSGVVGMIGVWVICNWRPGWPSRRSGVGEMFLFGANLTGFNVLNYFARNLDNILIGRVCGADSLGLYAKAYGLLMLPITQITGPVAAVAIPALSRLQDDQAEYARYYYKAINIVAFATMPIVFMLAALSEEVIMIILGEQWVGAARIFKVLAFAAAVQPVVNPLGWVFVSLGQTNRQMQWGLFAVPLTIVSFVVGLPWGAFGVAVSYTIVSLCLLTFPGLWWTFRFSPLSTRGWIKAVRCPLITSLIMYAGVEALHRFLPVDMPAQMLLLSSVVALACFVMVNMVWRSARAEVFAIYRVLSHLRKVTNS